MPREASKEAPRRQQRPAAQRAAEHLRENHRAGGHQRPGPALLFLGLLIHGRGRDDAYAPRPRWSCFITSAGELGAAKREELLGEERGEAVGADGDVEAGLGAGDNDPDGIVSQLWVIVPAAAFRLLLAGVEEADEAGGESGVDLSGPAGEGIGSGPGQGMGLTWCECFGDMVEELRLGERGRRRDGREKAARRRRHLVSGGGVVWPSRPGGYFIRLIGFCFSLLDSDFVFSTNYISNTWAGPNGPRPNWKRFFVIEEQRQNRQLWALSVVFVSGE